MNESSASESKHADLVGRGGHGGQPTRNPFAESASVTVEVPDTVQIRLVDASTLGDYEVWSFMASILGSAVTGFMVAYCQAEEDKSRPVGWMTFVLAILFIFTLFMAGYKRYRLRKKARSVKFRLDPEPIEE